MDLDLKGLGWSPINFTMAVELTECTKNPGVVFQVNTDALNPSLKGMPGITGAYVSGFMQPTLLTPTISGMGAFVIERHDGGTGKGYVSEFVQDVTGAMWFKAVPKGDGHHFDLGSGIDLNTLFEKSPYFKKPY